MTKDNNIPRKGIAPKNNSPPDLNQLLNNYIERFFHYLFGHGPTSSIIFLVAIVLAISLWTVFYTVPSDSVAVVQRFGKYIHNVPPGLHLKFPLGIDTITIVPVKRQLKQEFEFSI